MDELEATAKALVAAGKGILAADESSGTIAKRFADVGVESTEESRRAYRELLFTTDGAADFISGVILFDETIRQRAADGTPFPELLAGQGVIPGIKVDQGAKPLALAPGETITEGLDGLRERFEEYRALGARFAKWRAVIAIGDGIPSETASGRTRTRSPATPRSPGGGTRADRRAGGADGRRATRSSARTRSPSHVQRAVFTELHDQRVGLEGMLLKPNMVLAGYDCAATGRGRGGRRGDAALPAPHVPAAVPGIVFLSGGQSDEDATAHLDAINRLAPQAARRGSCRSRTAARCRRPRSTRGPDRRERRRRAGPYLKRARLNGAARSGRYDASLEDAA